MKTLSESARTYDMDAANERLARPQNGTMTDLHERPPFLDLSNAELPGDFDLVEMKYDGMWCEARVQGGRATLRSRTGKSKLEAYAPGLPDCTLIGEYLRGTVWSKPAERSGRFMVHDLLELRGTSLCERSLRDRRSKLERLFETAAAGCLPQWIGLIRQYPIRQWQRLWTQQVAAGEWEGLVFKHSAQRYGEPFGRMKAEVTQDYVCMGVNQSETNAEHVASFQGGLFIDGELRHVANPGALSDSMRTRAWKNPSRYIGRVFEAKGNALFDSGALRHPAFLRFRSDKLASECVLKGGAV